MGEGNGSSSEGDDGTDVDTGVAKSDGEKSLEVGHAQLRSLAKLEKPHRNKVQDTCGHLDGGNGPWVSKGIKGLLVVDIVGNVEKVPQGEVGTDLKSLSKSSLFGSPLGSVSRKLDSSSLGPKLQRNSFNRG